MTRTAIVIFNLGGPDKKESIRPFLVNFFMDKNIIRLPLPLRFLVANLIANRRSKREAGDSYGALGHRSPLLENTQAQAKALEQALGNGYKTFVCMRYWHPRARDVARAVKEYAPERVILLPFYPQYSTTTTRSSRQDWIKAAGAAGLKIPTSLICCYPLNDGFIKASVANIREVYDAARQAAVEKDLPAPRLLFSAHGLPESVIDDGDPYQWQCQRSARAIADALKIDDLDWSICYQSRVGPMKWIGPSTDEALEQAAKDGVPVVIYPHAFVNEHVETLVEIEIEYRHRAEQLGIPLFARVPTVGARDEFINGLAAMIRAQTGARDVACDGDKGRLCPAGFRRCCQQQEKMA